VKITMAGDQLSHLLIRPLCSLRWAVTTISVLVDGAVTGNLPVELENHRRSRAGQPRVLRPRPPRSRRRPFREQPCASPWSSRRLNALLRGLPDATRYLEVGVAMGLTLESIEAPTRLGVDPAPTFDLSRLPKGLEFFKGTSDDFFHQLDSDVYFDVVFLDGLHTFEQVYRDLLNTLAHLPDGAILIDDTVPSDEVSALPDQGASFARRRELGLPGLPWHGDVWKLVVSVARYHPELDFRTILGSGNPQTLLWKTHPHAEIAAPRPDAVEEIAALTYSEVFSGGLPRLFRPCDEHEALSACLTRLGPRRLTASSIAT
jgi:hypothetical protein